jgi:hypothetical protein
LWAASPDDRPANRGQLPAWPSSCREHNNDNAVNRETRAGFEQAKCYGTFGHAPLTSQTRLVIVAER